MKAWLRRWLGIVDYSGAIVAAGDSIRAENRSAIADLKSEKDAEMAGLVKELNDMRNSIPSAVAQSSNPGTRILRNWRDVRTALETPPPTIRIERNLNGYL